MVYKTLRRARKRAYKTVLLRAPMHAILALPDTFILFLALSNIANLTQDGFLFKLKKMGDDSALTTAIIYFVVYATVFSTLSFMTGSASFFDSVIADILNVDYRSYRSIVRILFPFIFIYAPNIIANMISFSSTPDHTSRTISMNNAINNSAYFLLKSVVTKITDAEVTLSLRNDPDFSKPTREMQRQKRRYRLS